MSAQFFDSTKLTRQGFSLLMSPPDSWNAGHARLLRLVSVVPTLRHNEKKLLATMCFNGN
jgi:hypothetical protein